MKYFITGGAGFIGSQMAERLLKMGHEVTVFDNLSCGDTRRIRHLMNRDDFHFVRGELEDKNAVMEAMKGHEFVMHFAANPDIARALAEPDIDLRWGVIATFNVLDAMRVNSIKKIVYPSGSGVYGDVGDTYTAEDFGPLLPISMYGASKLGAEGLIAAFSHMYDIQAWMFRFANIIGGRQTHGVTLDFVQKLRQDPTRLKILGDGSQSKSYVHVDEIIDAILYCAEHAHEKVNLYNVGTEDYITVKEIADIVVDEMGLVGVKRDYGKTARGWKGDVPIVRLDVSKLHKLGFKVKLSSKEAVQRTVRETIEELG